MSKKPKRKGIKKLFKFLLFIIVIIFIAFLLGAYVFDTKIKTVVVHNNNIISDEEIIDCAFPNDNYPNFFLTNSINIEKKLLKNELINSVDIKKKLFFELHIYVKENKPLFVREDTNKIVLNNKRELKNNETYNLNIPALINYVPDKKYDKLIEKLNLLDYTIIQKISDIKYDPNKYDEDRFLLYMNDSNKVYINLPKFKNLNKYNSMVEKFEGKKGTLYLDSGNYFKVDK